jgi:hypothetical protein
VSGERVTRKHHHPRDSYEAEVETTQYPPTYEHLQQEVERIRVSRQSVHPWIARYEEAA